MYTIIFLKVLLGSFLNEIPMAFSAILFLLATWNRDNSTASKQKNPIQPAKLCWLKSTRENHHKRSNLSVKNYIANQSLCALREGPVCDLQSPLSATPLCQMGEESLLIKHGKSTSNPCTKTILPPHQCHCILLESQVHTAYRTSLTLLTRRATGTSAAHSSSFPENSLLLSGQERRIKKSPLSLSQKKNNKKQ